MTDTDVLGLSITHICSLRDWLQPGFARVAETWAQRIRRWSTVARAFPPG